MADVAPTITVLAGTNGAGKSSIGGAMLSGAGAAFYNPDVETRALLAANPGMLPDEANAAAWRIGKEKLETAITDFSNFNLETTLGGDTITRLLVRAHRSGLRLRIWYCGLESAELHIARVQSRVRRGGHDIPQVRIRERYDASRSNLCTLVPALDELLLYDNSAEADPCLGREPHPVRLLHYRDGHILYRATSMPSWAKPIAAVVLGQTRRTSVGQD